MADVPGISEAALWAIILCPLAAFTAIALYLRKLPKVAGYVSIAAIAASFALALVALVDTLGADGRAVTHTHDWFHAGPLQLSLGVRLDGLTAVMLVVVTSVALLVQVYSQGYMEHDPGYGRYYAWMSLFITAMLGLVLADNLFMLFVFWELVGLSSYLLIGFWFHKPSAAAAAKKAFIVTRIGDLGLLAAMLLIWTRGGTLAIDEIHELVLTGALAGTTLTLFGLGLFAGAVGKSAQFPLHVWLPDAMEGPTPVSAMIHAATMVSAGVFLLVRMYPLYDQALELTSATMVVVAAVGAFTALFAATIALAQWDIKRVLAYSTISQLGYMVAALGIGAYAAALFHLLTHAFFKALLFLGSGSVIHGMEHGHEHAHGHADDPADHAARPSGLAHRRDGTLDPDDPQDMRNMGGLLRRMPATGYTFIIGGLALSGFPLVTAGFWSKDEILAFAFEGHGWVFLVLALAAFCTAFYTMRQMALTFGGRARTAMAAHAPESVRSMTVPLILISFFAVTLGWIGIPDAFPVLGSLAPNWLGLATLTGSPRSQDLVLTSQG